MLTDKSASPMMEYSFLGNSGLRVSNLCLGGLTFGNAEPGKGRSTWFFDYSRQLNEDAAHKVLDRFVELGGNFLDTADIYAYGNSERIIGSWMKSRGNREDVVVATKLSAALNPESRNRRGLSRCHMVKSVEESLERLQTDYIDLYQAHVWDNATPIEETLRTFDDLIRCGKIRYYGFSNVCGWQMQKIVDTAKELGLNKCISLQQQYNLLSRNSELEAFSVCRSEGVGILPWSPLKTGLLTGKLERDRVPDPTASRLGYVYQHTQVKEDSNWARHQQNDKYWELIDLLRDIAKAHDKTPPQVAIRWLLQKQEVASVIIGVTSLDQLENNCGAAAGWQLTTEEMKQLDEVSNVTKEYPYEMIWGPSNKTRYNQFNHDSLKY